MEKNVFTFSKEGNKEYSASIVRKDWDPICEAYKL